MQEPNSPLATAALPADRQFVSFELAGEMFAVPMGPVQEIIRLPEVAQLPLAPAALLGLANLRGRVLPLMSLRRLLGLPDQDHGDSARALVIHCGQALGFLVDRVCSVLQVEDEQLEPARALGHVLHAESLAGLIRRPNPQGQDELLMVLNFEHLVAQAFALTRHESSSSSASTGPAAADSETQAAVPDSELRLVSFTVDAQEYGVPIEEVQEIVLLPEQVTVLPQAPAHMRGVITLRQRLLPLVDLRSLFGLGAQRHDEHQRIVVVALPGCGPVGLVTDAVKEVLSVPRQQASQMPELLMRDGQLAEFDAICQLDEGRRLISVLSATRLLGLQALREAAAAAQVLQDMPPPPISGDRTMTLESSATSSASSLAEDMQLVVFRLGAEEFGVPIMCVQEIVRVPEQLTRVPRTPAFVEGVINLRGVVLPVIDQRARLGLPPLARNDGQRIMVFAQGAQRTGFIVDAVAEVLRVPQACLAPAPDLSGPQSRLIQQVARLRDGERLVMLIDSAQLLAWQRAAHELSEVPALAEPAESAEPRPALPLAA
ncbi:UNVERIFIED_ORG: chemotaxis protein CheW [Shinella sp. XGS7]|nr:chemotaxis protein CheW [Shinella sp. XGS7]